MVEVDSGGGERKKKEKDANEGKRGQISLSLGHPGLQMLGRRVTARVPTARGFLRVFPPYVTRISFRNGILG